jgi:hypothetical protein
MPRHDPARTGATDGPGNITQPAPYWRYSVGGSIDARSLMTLDVDSDGTREVVVLSGGRVAAKRAADPAVVNEVVWTSPLLQLEELVGPADLDGDGSQEIVARSSRQVFVLGASDGQVRWAEPPDEMGTIGGVRLADLDGDGSDDLLVQECGCCSVNSGKTGFAYRFAGDGASVESPVLLWTLPWVACGGYRPMAIAHMVPGGGTQVLLSAASALSLLDGRTGTVLVSTGDIGPNISASKCLPTDVDADGAQELVCVLNDPGPADAVGHRAFLVRYSSTPTPSLVMGWQQVIADLPGAVVMAAGLVGDLDDSGSLQLALSGQDSSGQSITYLYDARQGTLLAQIYGQEVAGIAPVGPAGRGQLLTRAHDALFAWSYASTPAPHVSLSWTMPGRRLATQLDFERARRSSLTDVPVTVDLDGDGIEDLVTVEATTGADLLVHRCSSGSPEAAGQYQAPIDSSLLQIWRAPTLQGPGERLVVAQSDGILHVLDAALVPLGGSPERGVRFGGYYSRSSFRTLRLEPVIASLDESPADAVVVSTSRGALERLDAKGATFADAPKRLWTQDHTFGAVVVAGLDAGRPAVVAIDNESREQHTVVALAASGSMLWQAPLPGITLTDLVPATIAGNGTADLYAQWGSPYDTVERIRAISGANGQTLWDGPELDPGNRQPSGAAAADWDGDGRQDLVFQCGGTHVLDAAGGTLQASSASGPTYDMPMLVDADGDGEVEATLHGGFAPLRTLDHDLQSVLWESTDDDRPYPYAAVAHCGEPGPTLVSASWQFPSRLKFTTMGGANAGSFTTLVLAGGQGYPDEATAEQGGATMGQLASPVVHADLAGDGVPVALVGSSDGWLYGVDACGRTSRFAVDLGAPVGSVTLGDTDGDGLDEIVASVADGYLYGLDQQVLSASAWVYDTDPPHGFIDQDVDEISTRDTLYASWAGVPGANSYAVAVVRDEFAGGGYVTDPPWLPVGNVTSSSIPYLELEDGVRYFVGVRALKGAGVSPDTLSDGVVVHIDPPAAEPDARPGSVLLTGRSCVYVCSVSPGRVLERGWLVAPAFLALFGLRRARGRSRLCGAKHAPESWGGSRPAR